MIQISEEEYQRLLDRETFFKNSPDLCYEISPDGKIKDCNQRVLDVLGYTKKELIGKPLISKVYASDSQKKAQALLEKWQKEGKLCNEELQVRTKSGQLIDVELNAEAVRDKQGNITHSTSVQRIISERKQAEERFRTIFGSTRACIITSGPDGKITSANPSTAQTLGYKNPDELLGMPTVELYANKEQRELLFSELTNKGYVKDYEATFTKKDGTPVYIQGSATLYRDEEGNILRTEGIFTDITRHKKAEEEISFLSKALESSPISVIATDITGRIIYTNQGAEKLFGYKKEEMLGKYPSMINADPNADKIQKEMTDAIKQNKVWKGEARKRKKDGSLILVSTSVYPLFDERRDLLGIFGFHEDITERKGIEKALAVSEAKYCSLVEGSLEGISISKGNRVVYANRAILDIFGYETVDEFSKVPLLDHVAPKSRKMIQERLKKRAKGESVVPRYEYSIIRKDGEIRDLEVSTSEVSVNGEKRVLGTFRDITERKKAEERLRQKTEDLNLINSVSSAVNRGDSLDEVLNLLSRETKRIFSSNGAALYLLSEDKKHLIMRTNLLDADLVSRVEQLIRIKIPEVKILLEKGSFYLEAIQKGKPQLIDDFTTILKMMGEFTQNKALKKLMPKISKALGLRSVVTTPLISEGEAIGLLDIARDRHFTELDLNRLQAISEQLTLILKRKMAEEAMRESERRYRTLFEKNTNPILVIDTEGNYVGANKAALQFLECTRKELITKNVQDFVPPEVACEQILNEHGFLWRTGGTLETEYWVHGEVKTLELVITSVSQKGADVVFGVGRDITERKEAEQKIENLAKFPSENPHPVLRIAKDSRLLYANEASSSLLKEWGCEIDQVIPDEWCQLIADSLDSACRRSIEIEHRDKVLSFAVVPIVDAGYVNWYGRDITDRKEAEEELKKKNQELQSTYRQLRETQAQLVQAAKLAALGELGAGVAHELNQPLEAIKCSAQLMMKDLSKESFYRDDLLRIEEQTKRMAKIVKNISAFARQTSSKQSALDINVPLEKALLLVSQQLKNHKIEIVKDFHSNLPGVTADSNQLQQVFLNLIGNARDALGIAEKENKRLTIITKPASDFVEITFTDNGCGIPKKDLEKVYDPFFTTKSVGQGTGLGLSVSYGIIEDHAGLMDITSQEGEGTVARVFLPAIGSKPCWEIKKCPGDLHKTCVAFKENKGHICWTVAGVYCRQLAKKADMSPIELCRECEVYSKKVILSEITALTKTIGF